mgnify:CR=1 FL=1
MKKEQQFEWTVAKVAKHYASLPRKAGEALKKERAGEYPYTGSFEYFMVLVFLTVLYGFLLLVLMAAPLLPKLVIALVIFGPATLYDFFILWVSKYAEGNDRG